jgi:hypothetical protein
MRLNNTYDLTGDNASVVRGFYASVPGGGWVGITMNRVAVFFFIREECGRDSQFYNAIRCFLTVHKPSCETNVPEKSFLESKR